METKNYRNCDNNKENCKKKVKSKAVLKVKRVRTNEKQFNLMIQFHESKNENLLSTESFTRYWEELTANLNKQGPPIRSSIEWKKVWTHRKYNMNRKYKSQGHSSNENLPREDGGISNLNEPLRADFIEMSQILADTGETQSSEPLLGQTEDMFNAMDEQSQISNFSGNNRSSSTGSQIYPAESSLIFNPTISPNQPLIQDLSMIEIPSIDLRSNRIELPNDIFSGQFHSNNEGQSYSIFSEAPQEVSNSFNSDVLDRLSNIIKRQDKMINLMDESNTLMKELLKKK